MNILLDTHIALWAIADSRKLGAKARKWIQSPQNVIWVSAVSVWEISIKHGLGRGDMPISGAQALAYFQSAGYRLLSVEPEHAAAVEDLPAHHGDPFDRLLIAQALKEPMQLVTHDAKIARYEDTILVSCV